MAKAPPHHDQLISFNIGICTLQYYYFGEGNTNIITTNKGIIVFCSNIVVHFYSIYIFKHYRLIIIIMTIGF